TSGWNAVALGVNGNVGIRTGAATEEAAVEAAMADCSTHDRICRVVAIGPFLVQGAPPTGARPADEAKLKELVATLKLASPEPLAEQRCEFAQRYYAMREHKVLAMVPGTARFWRSGLGHIGRSRGRNAGKLESWKAGKLESCQIYHGYPCAVVVVDDK